MTPLLEFRNVTVTGGRRVILDIEHLCHPQGQVLAVLGRNGAGKSTLLRVAGGLRRHDTGRILLDGSDSRAADRRAVSAAVLQRPLLRRGSVRANVASGLRFRRAGRRRAAGAAGEWIRRLGLEGLADADAATLSGGEAQRVSIARALALSPRLLLLDEPFAGLDAPTRAELLADVRGLLAELRVSAILVTHDRHEAALIADAVALLDRGAITQTGPTGEVLDHPTDSDAARLVGFDNIIASSRLPPTIHPAGALLALRPSDLRVVWDDQAPPECLLDAELLGLAPVDGAVRVTAGIGGTSLSATAEEASRLAALNRGARIRLGFTSGNARWLES